MYVISFVVSFFDLFEDLDGGGYFLSEVGRYRLLREGDCKESRL